MDNEQILIEEPVTKETLQMYLNKAHTLYLSKRLKECQQVYQKIHTSCPKHSTPYFFFGLLTKDPDLRQFYLEKCTQLQPTTFHAVAYCKLGYLSNIRVTSETLYHKAKDLDPYFIHKQEQYEQYMTRLEWAQFLSCFKVYDSTVFKILDEEQKKDPENYLVYYQRAISLSGQFKYQESLEEYAKASKLAPGNHVIKNQMAFILNQLQHYEKGLEMGYHALQNKQSNIGHNNVGYSLTKLKRYDEAIEHYKKSLNINPNFPTTYMNIVYPLVKTNQIQEAVRLLEKLLKIVYDTNSLQKIYFVMGEVLFQGEYYNRAIQSYQKSLEINEDQCRVMYCVGMCYQKQGMYTEALQYFQQSLKISPTFSTAYTQIGYIYIVQKRYDDAIKNYEQALQYNNNDPVILQNIGYCKLQKKQFAEAVNNYVTAVELKQQAFQDIQDIYIKNKVQRILDIKKCNKKSINRLALEFHILKENNLWKKLFRKEINFEIGEFLTYQSSLN